MHDGHPLRNVSEIGTGEGAEFMLKTRKSSAGNDREPMTLETFKSAIRNNLAKSAQIK
jgi:hypothetical protein